MGRGGVEGGGGCERELGAVMWQDPLAAPSPTPTHLLRSPRRSQENRPVVPTAEEN